jgi:hypothetical protein
MADTYVEIGPMAYVKDTTKVPIKYATEAQKLMKEAATAAVRASVGFTPDKVGNPEGYWVDLTLSEIVFGPVQDRPGVTCKFVGTVATFPAKRVLTSTLTGKGMVGAGGKEVNDGDVRFAIQEGVKATIVKSVLPYLKTNP